MCLIIYRDKSQIVTDDFAKDVATRNRDGWGFMYNHPETNKVITKKGLVLDDFFTHYHPVQEADIPCIIHFRMKTHGAINLDNCHPYEICKGVYFMHNGCIKVETPTKDINTLSDTAIFVRDILRPMFLNSKDRISLVRSPWFEHMMEVHADKNNSRYVISDIEGSVFFGSWYETTTGLFFSNQYAYTLDNPTRKTCTPTNNYPRHHTGYYGNSRLDDDEFYYGYSSNNTSGASNKTLKELEDYNKELKAKQEKIEPFRKKEGETVEAYSDRVALLAKDSPELMFKDGEEVDDYQKRIGLYPTRAEQSVAAINSTFGKTKNDYHRYANETALAYYRRHGASSQTPRFKLNNEEDVEFKARMKGDYDDLLRLPSVLDVNIVSRIASEYNATVLEAEKEIRTDRNIARLYFEVGRDIIREANDAKLDKIKAEEKEEVDSSVIPFPHQSTMEQKKAGNPNSSTVLPSALPKSNGKDYTSENGNLQERNFKDNKEGLNQVPTDPFEGLDRFSDFVDAFSEKELLEGDYTPTDEELMAGYLENLLEEEIENFELVAEEDWLLDQATIEECVDRITKGEFKFKYDPNGCSTLSNSEGVIYPDYLMGGAPQQDLKSMIN